MSNETTNDTRNDAAGHRLGEERSRFGPVAPGSADEASGAERRTDLVDEFLERHAPGLPGHVIDFALDVRGAIAELESELERLRIAEPV